MEKELSFELLLNHFICKGIMRCETDKNTKNKYDLTWMTSTFVPPSTLDPILVRVSTYTQAQIVNKFIFTCNPEMILD